MEWKEIIANPPPHGVPLLVFGHYIGSGNPDAVQYILAITYGNGWLTASGDTWKLEVSYWALPTDPTIGS